jgi:hypothetical protein
MQPLNHLFNTNNVPQFQFTDDIQQLSLKYSIDGIKQENFMLLFHLPKTNLNILSSNDALFLIPAEAIVIQRNSFFEKHSLYLGKFFGVTDKINSPQNINFNTFVKSVFKQELHWLTQYFEWVEHYLTVRISDGIPLTQHDTIRISLAEIIETILLVKTILTNKQFDKSSLNSISSLLLTGTKKLSKCAGGRSFIGNSILEFHCLATFLNQYLLGEVRHAS